jgi:hypothetical protein
MTSGAAVPVRKADRVSESSQLRTFLPFAIRGVTRLVELAGAREVEVY